MSSSNLHGLNADFSSIGKFETTCEYNLFPFSSGNAGNGNYYAGPADKLDLKREGLHFSYEGIYNDVSPGFVTVPGFVNRVDIRGIYQELDYRFRPKKGWIVDWGPSLNQRYVFDHEGNRLDTDYEPYLAIQGRGQTLILLYPYQELRERSAAAGFRVSWFIRQPESRLPRAPQRGLVPNRLFQEGYDRRGVLLGRWRELCARLYALHRSLFWRGWTRVMGR